MIMHFQKNWFWAHNNPSFIKHQELKAFIYGQNINNGEASQKLFDTSLLQKTILSFKSFPTKQRMGLPSLLQIFIIAEELIKEKRTKNFWGFTGT